MSAGAELRTGLARLGELLARSGDAYWSRIVRDALTEPDDRVLARSVQDLLTDPRGLGGLVLSPAAGHAAASCAVDATNRAFNTLRREAFELARTLSAGSPGSSHELPDNADKNLRKFGQRVAARLLGRGPGDEAAADQQEN